MAVLDYSPPPTVRQFMLDPSTIRLIMGPVGCTPGHTEYLTPTGWRRIDQYRQGDPVAVWDEDGCVRFEVPKDYIDVPAEGFYTFSNATSSMELSPGHRVPYYDYRGVLAVKTAAQLYDRPSVARIPTTFVAPEQPETMSDAEVRLRVAFAADGHLPRRGQQAIVTVRKDRKKERIGRLLSENGVDYVERVSEARPTESRFVFARGDLGRNLDFVWRLPARQLAVVLDECTRWDGLDGHPERRFYSTSKADADAIQYAAHATGVRATMARIEYAEDWSDGWIVYIRRERSHKNAWVVRDATERTFREPEDGERQYCFTTSTGFWVARNRDTVFVTGNSAKSTGCIFTLVYEGMRQPPGPDGIRRTRYAVVRNTNQQLMDTTFKSFNAFFKDGQAGKWRATDKTFVLKPAPDTEIEFMFRPLDTEDDIGRLLSLEVSGIWFNEAREINHKVYLAAIGRIGRYPSKINGGCARPLVLLDTNPPEEDSWLYDMVEKIKPDNVGIYIQPPALIPGTYEVNPDAENLENLPDDYYETQVDAAKDNDEYINVYLRVMYGRTNAGKPVLPMFDKARHVARRPLEPNPLLPLYVGFDPGMNSGLVFGQYTLNGQLLCYDAIATEQTGTERLIREKIRPMLANKYRDFEVIFCPDPAAAIRSNVDERTALDALSKAGYRFKFVDKNNQLQPRLEAAENFLTRQVETGAALQLDPEGCKPLIRALDGGYRYPESKRGVEKDTPEKNEHSHVADAFQYLCRVVQHAEARSAREQKYRFQIPRFKNPYAI